MQDLEDTQEDLSASICCCFRWCLHQMISGVTISKPKQSYFRIVFPSVIALLSWQGVRSQAFGKFMSVSLHHVTSHEGVGPLICICLTVHNRCDLHHMFRESAQMMMCKMCSIGLDSLWSLLGCNHGGLHEQSNPMHLFDEPRDV